MKKLTFRDVMTRLAVVLIWVMTSCTGWDIDTDEDEISAGVGSVLSEQVVVVNASWRKVLSNITGYTFKLNSQGLLTRCAMPPLYTLMSFVIQSQPLMTVLI